MLIMHLVCAHTFVIEINNPVFGLRSNILHSCHLILFLNHRTLNPQNAIERYFGH